jgi:hypothetical protein
MAMPMELRIYKSKFRTYLNMDREDCGEYSFYIYHEAVGLEECEKSELLKFRTLAGGVKYVTLYEPCGSEMDLTFVLFLLRNHMALVEFTGGK